MNGFYPSSPMNPLEHPPKTMSLVDALLAARDPDSSPSLREAGARAVQSKLMHVAKKYARLDREELVAQVWVRALTKRIDALEESVEDSRREPALHKWLATVVDRVAMDAYRRRKREQQRTARADAAPGEDAFDGRPFDGQEEEGVERIGFFEGDAESRLEHAAIAERALDAVRCAFERARAGCTNDAVRHDFDEAWGEINALVEGTTRVEQLLAPFVATPEFSRQRNALYKRHERARQRVLAACDAMAEGAALSPEALEHAKAAVEGYFKRRQIRPGDASNRTRAKA